MAIVVVSAIGLSSSVSFGIVVVIVFFIAIGVATPAVIFYNSTSSAVIGHLVAIGVTAIRVIGLVIIFTRVLIAIIVASVIAITIGIVVAIIRVIAVITSVRIIAIGAIAVIIVIGAIVIVAPAAPIGVVTAPA